MFRFSWRFHCFIVGIVVVVYVLSLFASSYCAFSSDAVITVVVNPNEERLLSSFSPLELHSTLFLSIKTLLRPERKLLTADTQKKSDSPYIRGEVCIKPGWQIYTSAVV